MQEEEQAAGTRRFRVGDYVRFRPETRERLGRDIAPDEVGTVVRVQPDPPPTGPTYQIEVEFPRARARPCWSSEYELVQAAPENAAETP